MNALIQEKLPNPFKAQGQQISYSGVDTAFCDLYNKEQMIKFAELIVQECMTKVSEWDMGIDDPVGATDNTSVVARDMVAEIKQHFGVEL